MPRRSERSLYRRLTMVLRQQSDVVGCLERHEITPANRAAIARLLADMRWLQTTIWNMLATQRRARLLAAAKQLDQMAEQWTVVATQLGISMPEPKLPPAGQRVEEPVLPPELDAFAFRAQHYTA